MAKITDTHSGLLLTPGSPVEPPAPQPPYVPSGSLTDRPVVPPVQPLPPAPEPLVGSCR